MLQAFSKFVIRQSIFITMSHHRLYKSTSLKLFYLSCFLFAHFLTYQFVDHSCFILFYSYLCCFTVWHKNLAGFSSSSSYSMIIRAEKYKLDLYFFSLYFTCLLFCLPFPFTLIWTFAIFHEFTTNRTQNLHNFSFYRFIDYIN